jgi:hypothetical protein
MRRGCGGETPAGYFTLNYYSPLNVTLDEMKLAGIEEAKLAAQNGEVDEQGCNCCC